MLGTTSSLVGTILTSMVGDCHAQCQKALWPKWYIYTKILKSLCLYIYKNMPQSFLIKALSMNKSNHLVLESENREVERQLEHKQTFPKQRILQYLTGNQLIPIGVILLILKVVCCGYCSLKIFHKEPTSKR
ncbi:hypothetical protein PROFUN_09728 [Planoprotostelium fungivorum]|uniref:Uncharacterized protein n=1 Tax=Planoprotostelium fungivorum TaxID=1890364 RepID=A0A2P6NEX2_9EUKA|nr:hypothetical protein PROFUN_09728 [Planoprotostelium fungivorum]